MAQLAIVRQFTVVVSVALTVSVAVPSCGSEPEDPYGSFGAFLDQAGDVEGAEAYDNRVQASLQQCMEELGYSVSVETVDSGPEIELPSLKQVLYGVLYLDGAAVEAGIGYGFVDFRIAVEDWFETAPDPFGSWEPDSYAQAQQHNADYRSCQEAVPGFVERLTLSTEVLDAAAELPRQVFDDERLAATNAAWSACMQHNGYAFGSPLDAFREIERLDEEVGFLDDGDFDHGHSGITPNEYFDTAEPIDSRRAAKLQLQLIELEIASDDLHCREQVGADYSEIAAEIDREHAAKYRAQMERIVEIVEAEQP